MATRSGGAEGYRHWLQYRERGEPMPCAIVLGPPPAVAYCAPQKLQMGLDEVAVAGGIAGAPIGVVRCRTVDLTVPAESEIVIEGLIDTELVEPEAPFGESHGHVALEDYNMIMRVTAITHRRGAILPSIISQVTPSESSIIKRVAYEPLFLTHLTDRLGIKGVRRVVMHEPLTNIRRVIFVQFERGGPKTEDPDFEDSTLLIDATLKGGMPPVALPREAYMDRARKIWEHLDLPPLVPESPWAGYSLGDWEDRWEAAAGRAVAGDYLENGRMTAQRQRRAIEPETPVRWIDDDD